MQKYSANIETIIAFLVLLVIGFFFVRVEYYKHLEEKSALPTPQEKE